MEQSTNIWNNPWIPSLSSHKPKPLNPWQSRLTWVQELMDETCRNWNVELVQSAFPTEENEAILKIKEMDPNSMDKLLWLHNPSGKVTVAEVYKTLVEEKWRKLDIPGSSSQAKDLLRARNRIWSTRVAGKLKHFVWKCFNNSLAVNNALNHRLKVFDPICKTCGEENETIEHLLFHCSKSSRVWKLAVVQWDGLEDCTHSFKQWWTKLRSLKLNAMAEQRIQLTIYTLWWLWKARNLWVFQNHWLPEFTIVQATASAWLEFRDS